MKVTLLAAASRTRCYNDLFERGDEIMGTDISLLLQNLSEKHSGPNNVRIIFGFDY